MRDSALRHDEILDPIGKKYWPLYKGRDGCRSPMQWDDRRNAGFSTGKPWHSVNPDYLYRNVKIQQADTRSILNFTKIILNLRRKYPGLYAYHACSGRAGSAQFQRKGRETDPTSG
jgi:alpha-glucosidase